MPDQPVPTYVVIDDSGREYPAEVSDENRLRILLRWDKGSWRYRRWFSKGSRREQKMRGDASTKNLGNTHHYRKLEQP